jgi:carboxymethylenebutenolidase
MPASGAAFPVVLVIQEIFGVHEYIRDVCRRLAKEGYLAIAPSLYDRQGDVSQMEDIGQIFSQVVMKVPDAQVMADLDAAVKWAEGEKGDTARLGIMGFCWGGRVVWLYSAHSDLPKAGAAWYGRLASKTEPGSKTAIEAAGELKFPVIGFYGGQDHGIPLADVENMKAAIQPPSHIVVYDDAGHGFHADYRPGYHEAAAHDAWAKMLAFFKEYGVA